jgi:hypothetical protein
MDSKTLSEPPDASGFERLCVELRVYCGELDPSEVSARLGLEPTEVLRRGAKVTNSAAKTRVHKINGWFLSSERRVAALDAAAHVEWLLTALSPKTRELAGLLQMDGVEARIACIGWIREAGAGLSLAPTQLRSLADLNIPVEISISHYASEPE